MDSFYWTIIFMSTFVLTWEESSLVLQLPFIISDMIKQVGTLISLLLMIYEMSGFAKVRGPFFFSLPTNNLAANVQNNQLIFSFLFFSLGFVCVYNLESDKLVLQFYKQVAKDAWWAEYIEMNTKHGKFVEASLHRQKKNGNGQINVSCSFNSNRNSHVSTEEPMYLV